MSDGVDILTRIVGALVSLGCGVIAVFGFRLNLQGIILCFYVLLFAFVSLLAEMRLGFLLRWFKILSHHAGRGFFYIFIGSLTLGIPPKIAGIIVGACTICFGLSMVFMNQCYFKSKGERLSNVVDENRGGAGGSV